MAGVVAAVFVWFDAVAVIHYNNKRFRRIIVVAVCNIAYVNIIILSMLMLCALLRIFELE